MQKSDSCPQSCSLWTKIRHWVLQVFSLLPALSAFDVTKTSEAVVLFKDSFDATGPDHVYFIPKHLLMFAQCLFSFIFLIGCNGYHGLGWNELDKTSVSIFVYWNSEKPLVMSTKQMSASGRHIRKTWNICNSTCSGLMGSVVVKMSE